MIGIGGLRLTELGLIETKRTWWVRISMPAKYGFPIWVLPEPGTYSPRLPAAKGKRVDCPYIGLVLDVSPGERAPAPYNADMGRTTFHGVNTGLVKNVGR